MCVCGCMWSASGTGLCVWNGMEGDLAEEGLDLVEEGVEWALGSSSSG